MALHDSISYYSTYRRYAKAHGSWGIGIGLVERLSVRIFASPRTYMSRMSSLAECYRLAMALREVLSSPPEPRLAHLPEVLDRPRESGGPEVDSTDVDS